MSATNFNTRNDTYRKLMGNGLTYQVPRFQRDYSWGEDEWDDLWQDILGTVKTDGEPAHYMGYLVLQTSNDKVFDVIDGQQRLTTLSIIVLAALRNLKRLIADGTDAENTQKRLDGLRQTYVGYLDPVTLVPRSKLTLNRNNDTYYQTYLVPLKEQLPQRGFKSSEHSLRKAFEWYDRRISEHAKGQSEPGMFITQLIDSMSDKLFFTVITVNDELNAYKVFETLNARGVRLSATDLLKNYLFSVLHREGGHEAELKALDDRWERIVGKLGAESFPDFLRVHWIGHRSFVRQADLFKTIRGNIAGRGEVFALITGLEDDMDTYLALVSPEASAWPPRSKDFARTLRMFSVRQPYPLILAARKKLKDDDFEAFLRATVILSFRYNVIGNLQTNEQEKTYHAEAGRLAKGEHQTLKDILDGLRTLYVSDEAFRASFAEKTIVTNQSRNNRIVRYILCRLELQETQANHDFESDSLSIEHICPQNPDPHHWSNFSDEEVEAFVYRIGNMTLLETSRNRDVGNEDFKTKAQSYRESLYAMTQHVAEQNIEWSPSRIAARQNAMAKQATAIWRIAHYG